MEFLLGAACGLVLWFLLYLLIDPGIRQIRAEYRRKSKLYDKIAAKYVVVEGPRGDVLVHDPKNRRRSRAFPPPGPGAGSPTFDFVIEEEAI